jgi:hypothetical protein
MGKANSKGKTQKAKVQAFQVLRFEFGILNFVSTYCLLLTAYGFNQRC